MGDMALVLLIKPVQHDYILHVLHLSAVLAQEPALLRICCAATVLPAAAGPVASSVQAHAAAHPGPFVEAGVGVLGQSRFTTLRAEALRHCCSQVSKLFDRWHCTSCIYLYIYIYIYTNICV